ncbi:MAG: NYN domain-containing protein [Clostridia bacterium]|nr:NYN domain-containing protein [Clostridia bacterium]
MHRKVVLLVDAYNIINAWSELKYLAEHDLEGAREKLNNDMLEYAAYYGEEVYIVYDAYARDNKLEHVETINHVHIIYTKENQTADSYIEKKVATLSEDPRLLIKVVTSDWVQQRQVLGSGGIRLTPYELKDKCTRIISKVQRKMKLADENHNKNSVLASKLASLLNKSQK